MAAFQRQFPEVIDLLSRSVRAGHSFASGMEIVSTDLPDPVSTEFRITFDEQRFGLPLRDALLSLCERVPLVDVRLFVIALLVQKETGGNLVEILDNLAHVIRERFRIAGEVRVRTAQGRLTAGILMALPLVMMLMLHLLDPDYIKILFVEPLGQMMLIVAGVMQVVGAVDHLEDCLDQGLKLRGGNSRFMPGSVSIVVFAAIIFIALALIYAFSGGSLLITERLGRLWQASRKPRRSGF